MTTTAVPMAVEEQGHGQPASEQMVELMVELTGMGGATDGATDLAATDLAATQCARSGADMVAPGVAAADVAAASAARGAHAACALAACSSTSSTVTSPSPLRHLFVTFPSLGVPHDPSSFWGQRA